MRWGRRRPATAGLLLVGLVALVPLVAADTEVRRFDGQIRFIAGLAFLADGQRAHGLELARALPFRRP